MSLAAGSEAAWMPCSDRSRQRGDPLAGTGGFGARWLLVEIDSGWGRHAFFDSSLDAGLGREIVRRAEAAGIRPVAIRRYGRRADERRAQCRWRWALADARRGREGVRWGEVGDPADLLEIPLDGSAGTPSDAPVLLVCTHARHDRCCAVRGRPVAAELAEAFPDQTWECSHLGGDRFAATMILLPHGLYYGRVPAGEAAGIVERYLDGEIVEEYFRGRSSLRPHVQAAQAAVRRETGKAQIGGLAVLDERHTDGQWHVDLEDGDRVATVTLREAWSEPLLSTCGARVPASVRRWEPESVTWR